MNTNSGKKTRRGRRNRGRGSKRSNGECSKGVSRPILWVCCESMSGFPSLASFFASMSLFSSALLLLVSYTPSQHHAPRNFDFLTWLHHFQISKFSPLLLLIPPSFYIDVAFVCCSFSIFYVHNACMDHVPLKDVACCPHFLTFFVF